VFEAAGYGVALTVAPVREPLDRRSEPAPTDVHRRRSRLTDLLDPAGFDDASWAREMSAVSAGAAKLAAYEAALVASMAARRPAQTDLTADQPGHRVEGWVPDRVPVGVSEFFADELAMVKGISRTAATVLAERSLALVHELPATWAALADGAIDPARANAIVRALAGQSVEAGGAVQPGVVTEVEAQALEWALAGETPQRLQDRGAAALIAADESAADRRRKKAERHADVTMKPAPDGMAQLVADLPAPVAAACRETVDGYARMAKADGDERPIGQLRAEALADLILRPWDTSREPVTAHLTVLAPLAGLAGDAGGDAATVDGSPITAPQLRELLEQLDALCPGGLQAPAGGSLNVSLLDPATGALRATVTERELTRLARRGCPTHPDAECGCPVLDRPPPVDRYEPTPAQHRHVRARDRTCRHPSCRRPAARTDTDHVTAYADGGATDCANLCCLCRRHHRLKTHGRHWRYRMTPDGTLTVTTPSGVTRTTRPPGLVPPDSGDRPPF